MASFFIIYFLVLSGRGKTWWVCSHVLPLSTLLDRKVSQFLRKATRDTVPEGRSDPFASRDKKHIHDTHSDRHVCSVSVADVTSLCVPDLRARSDGSRRWFLVSNIISN